MSGALVVGGPAIAYATVMVAATGCFARSIVGFGASCPTTGYQMIWYGAGGAVFVIGIVGLVRGRRAR